MTWHVVAAAIHGGASRKGHKFLKHLKAEAEVVTARLENHAGIIGAALAAAPKQGR